MSPQSHPANTARVRRLRRVAKAARTGRWAALAVGIAGITLGIIGLRVNLASAASMILMGITLSVYWYVYTIQAKALAALADRLARDTTEVRVVLTADTSSFLDALRAARADMGEDGAADEVQGHG